MPKPIAIHSYTYTIPGHVIYPSTVHTGSTDLEEVRALIANTYRVDPGLIEIRRNT